MKQRNPIVVILLSFITLGIYSIVWEVKTKNEMNKLGSSIPTAWLIIVPIVSIWWLWKYSQGVEKTTNGDTSGVLAFVLLFLLGLIGIAIVQYEFNKVDDQPMAATPQPLGQPAPGFGSASMQLNVQEAPAPTPLPAQPQPQPPVDQPNQPPQV